MNKKFKIFITGGHLTPALAVIEELIKRNDWQIYFVGRKYALEGEKSISVEYKIITEQKIPFLVLTTGRWQRKFTIYTFISWLKIPIGLISSFWYLFKYRPDIILSFGGYLALPMSLAGYLFRIPVITHEQTVSAGLSNRIIAKLAVKVCLSYPSSQKYFPKEKTVLTGNPLRKEIWQKTPVFWQKSLGRPILYITGGSLGAHFINQLIEEIIEPLLTGFFVIHQTGQSVAYNDYQRLEVKEKQLPENLKGRYFLRPYIKSDEIGWVLNSADLIISRAGANTTAEIMTLRKPVIFIPLPYADEQKENALLAKSTTMVVILPQEDLKSTELLKEIRLFWQQIKARKKGVDTKTVLPQNTAALLIVKEIYEGLLQKQ